MEEIKNSKPQTREERQKELESNKKKSAELLDQIESRFNAFLSDLRDVNVKHNHEYNIGDEVPLKELKNTIEKIPKEILIQKTTKHTIEKVSHRFLWSYFVTSSIVMALCFGFATWSYFYYSAKDEAREARELEILHQGQDEGTKAVFQHLPKKTQAYMLKKFPDVFGDLEE